MAVRFSAPLPFDVSLVSRAWNFDHANSSLSGVLWSSVGSALESLRRKDPDIFRPADHRLRKLFECRGMSPATRLWVDDPNVSRMLNVLRRPRRAVYLSREGIEVVLESHVTSARRLRKLLSAIFEAASVFEEEAARLSAFRRADNPGSADAPMGARDVAFGSKAH